MTRLIFAFIALFWTTIMAVADDNRVGYYHPEATSEEAFERVIRDGGDSNKAVRVDFINSITRAQLAAPESPRFVFFFQR